MGRCKTILTVLRFMFSSRNQWFLGEPYLRKWNHYVGRRGSVPVALLTVRDTASCPASIRRSSG